MAGTWTCGLAESRCMHELRLTGHMQMIAARYAAIRALLAPLQEVAAAMYRMGIIRLASRRGELLDGHVQLPICWPAAWHCLHLLLTNTNTGFHWDGTGHKAATMTMTALTQQAIKVVSAGKVAVVNDAPLPSLKDGDILVKIACVAINPGDGKSLAMSPTPGALVGSDFAGTVFSLGNSNIGTLKVGDGVCGCLFGNNPFRVDNGAFAEYVAVPAGLVFRIPEGMGFEEAATLGTALATSGLALYHVLKLPLPSQPASKPAFALVYGGGTATGTIAIQLLKLCVFSFILLFLGL